MPRGVLRPAMDRMRESMFGILGNMEGDSFLDLFSGSGIVGLEACSRYASVVHFVEMDAIKKPTILENLKIASDSQTQLFITRAENYIKTTSLKYNFIHLDPPFPLANKEMFLKLISYHKILADNGTITIHYPAENKLADEIDDLKKYDERKYGRSVLAFYTYK